MPSLTLRPSQKAVPAYYESLEAVRTLGATHELAVKQADVLSVVYTPQTLMQLMFASVAHVLREHFGTSLDAKGVHILDPFTSTGNFIVNIMQPGHISVAAAKQRLHDRAPDHSAPADRGLAGGVAAHVSKSSV